jgi:hypothetical protein
MKSLAFLFVASILFLFVGLLISEGQTPPPGPAQSFQAPPLPAPPKANGSANQSRKLTTPPAAAPAKSTMADALNTDDLCLAALTVGMSFHAHSQEEISGALRALGAPTSLQEMTAASGPLFGPIEAKKRFSSPFLNFIYALRMASILNFSTNGSVAEHGQLALTILKELEAADSSNGAFPYFQLGIMRELKYKEEEIKETAERVARASHFDAMLTAQMAELEGSRWQSATHFYVLDWLSQQINSISYYSSLDAINGVTGGPGGDDLKDRIGLLMMQEGQRASRRAQYHGFDGGAYSYGTIFHSGDDDEYLANLSDRIAGYQWKYAPYVSRDQGDCKREEFDAYYEEMRGHP